MVAALRVLWSIATVALAAIPTTAGLAAVDDIQQSAYELLYDALREGDAQTERGVTVEGLVFERDAATFQLHSGQLHLLQPFEGRTPGAVWIGQGRFRLFRVEGIDLPIRRAVFFFTDPVYDVFPGLAWEPGIPPGEARREVEEAMRYLADGDGWMSRDFAAPRFHRREEYEAGRSVREEAADVIGVRAYEVESIIEENLDFSARATLTFERLLYGFDWLPSAFTRSSRWNPSCGKTGRPPSMRGRRTLRMSGSISPPPRRELVR